jgi:hypothetical protein
MVTTRGQSAGPEKRRPINYAELADMSPSRKKSVSPSTATLSNRTASTGSSSPNHKPSRAESMAASPAAKKVAVKSQDGAAYAKGDTYPRSPRKVSRPSSNGTRESKAKTKPAHKVDNSGNLEFGGTFGTASMMIFFPILMYYLWVCSTFYGGNIQFKKSSETWLAFADRMIAHVIKVHFF